MSDDGREMIEHEAYGNCPGPYPPLAHRHHLTTREAIARPLAWMDANVAVASTLPFSVKPWEALEVHFLRTSTNS